MDNERDQNTPTIDRFSSLPDEVLDAILEEAAQPNWYEKHPTREVYILQEPLSKRLWPAQQRCFYRQVSITDADWQLCQFIEALKPNPALAKYVQELDLSFGWTCLGVGSGDKVNEPGDDVPPQMLKDFFQALVAVKSIRSSLSTRIAESLLSTQVAKSLPQLRRLDIHAEFNSLKDPFHPAHFLALPLYANLSSFSLCIERKSSSIKPYDTPCPTSFPTLSLGELNLRGPVLASSGLKGFLEQAKDLKRLLLGDESDSFTPGSLDSLLRALPSPASLQRFAIYASASISTDELSSATLIFTNLEELSIVRGFKIASSFYQAVRQLPLKSLCLGNVSGVAVKDLTALVSGSTKHPTLKELVLSCIGPYGPSEAVWTKTFTAKGVKKLAKVATKEGIDVSGDAVAAVEEEEMWAKVKW